MPYRHSTAFALKPVFPVRFFVDLIPTATTLRWQLAAWFPICVNKRKNTVTEARHAAERQTC